MSFFWIGRNLFLLFALIAVAFLLVPQGLEADEDKLLITTPLAYKAKFPGISYRVSFSIENRLKKTLVVKSIQSASPLAAVEMNVNGESAKPVGIRIRPNEVFSFDENRKLLIGPDKKNQDLSVVQLVIKFESGEERAVLAPIVSP